MKIKKVAVTYTIQLSGYEVNLLHDILSKAPMLPPAPENVVRNRVKSELTRNFQRLVNNGEGQLPVVLTVVRLSFMKIDIEKFEGTLKQLVTDVNSHCCQSSVFIGEVNNRVVMLTVMSKVEAVDGHNYEGIKEQYEVVK